MQYAFEDFVIDSDRRELTRSAEPIAERSLEVDSEMRIWTEGSVEGSVAI